MASNRKNAAQQPTSDTEKTGVLSNVSFTTVIASALAAGTSLVLSSKIGLAGSVIGTVVAAAVSSLALQIYQSLLSKTAEKVNDVANLTSIGSPTDDTAAAEGGVGERTHDGETVVQRRPVTLSDKTGVIEVAESGTPIAPDSIRYAAHARESKYNTRRALIVSIVAALVALAVTAGIITLATAGHGLGSTTTFSAPVVSTETTDDSASDQQTSGADQSSSQTTDTDSTQTNQNGQSSESGTTTNGTTTNGTTTDSGNTSGTGTSTETGGTGTNSNSSSSSGTESGGTSGGTDSGNTSDSGNTNSGATTTPGTSTDSANGQ